MFGKNALVVDDSLTARAVLKHQLNQFDVVVESASDGSHALKMLRSHTPDVIFLDHVMPGLDGFEVLERLKADKATRRIPVVMYTSQAAPNYIREAKVLGAVAVIPKNVTDEELVAALNKAEVYQLGAANDDRHSEQAIRPGTPSTASISPAPEPEPLVEPVPEREQPAARTQWPLTLLLIVLLCSQAYMHWRYGEQQAINAELRQVVGVQTQKIYELNYRLDVHQTQLNSTNADLAEVIMNLLMARVGEVDSPEAPATTEETMFDDE